MKKFYYFPLVSIALMAFAFTSCSEDDNEPANGGGGGTGGSSQSAASSVITTSGGEKLLLTNVGSGYYDGYSFSYDSNGRPIKAFEEYDGGYAFSYNPFKMSYVDGEYDDWGYEISGTLNSKGYLATVTEEENNEDEAYKSSSNLEYDKAGHLVKAKGNYTETYYEDGKKYTEKGSMTCTYTWQNGNLTKIEQVEKWGENSRIENVTLIHYGNQKNTYNQYTVGLSDEITGCLSMVGMTGIGTDFLPISIESTYTEIDENDKYADKESYTYTYTLNNNGTVAVESERYDGYTDVYNYTYSPFGESRVSVPGVNRETIKNYSKKDKHQYLFRIRSIHKMLK